ncbi:MAG: hypothetical protein IJG37_08235, partial [Synergistaceae bacterium]|nr:hypothetical protein [Synergistaceae bacterium]
MRSKSLRSHFLILYVILAVVSGIVVPFLCVKMSVEAFRNYQIQRRQADLENLGESLANLYDEEGGVWKRRRVMDILRPAPQWAGMIIALIDADGREVYTLRPMPMTRRNHNSQPEAQPPESETEHMTIILARNKGRLEIERRIPTGRYEASFITYLMNYTLAGALLMIVFACGLGYFVAGKLSRPVILAIERTKNIARGDYDVHEEAKPVGIRELDALSRGVEDLGRSLAGQEKLRRRLMVD